MIQLRSSVWAVPLLLTATAVGITLVSSALGTIAHLSITIAAVTVLLVIPAIGRSRRGQDLSPFLLVPTLFSAFQNVYLIKVAGVLAPFDLQVTIILNVIDAAILLVGLLLTPGKLTAAFPDALTRLFGIVAATIWTVITAYALFAVIALNVDIPAVAASYRNLITPLLFLLLGIVAAGSTDPRTFARGVTVLSVALVAFALVETVAPHFWHTLGISALWHAKRLHTFPGLDVPTNFVSSERVGGERLVRRGSAFADPVHFGTFLFAAFVMAWWLRKWAVVILCAIGGILAISKGMLISLLVFAAIWPLVHGGRLLRVVVIAAVTAAGAVFVIYSALHSTGSVTAHVNGLVSAFRDLPDHPLGLGVGRAGVLAEVFGAVRTESGQESGLGVIAAQLGIPGIILFVALFGLLTWTTWRFKDPRARVTGIAVTLAFAANAAFNEVALSPNSAAPYCILLGLLITRDGLTRRR
ncbi:hypothetical protein [Curtobacterium sp. MCLR17_054]|uniref:hypothetical protein n=1 Tax=Curtobacterium sp. MCLR17_054 TaxID=2175632 RepID=UPI0011B66D9B|nr:hypothetical protein [Curtobacterium sp. MCLR17_054]WIE70306.1 hypothetical protein DEJ08_018180 [Curtobacterium sp. MCLR17_054]